MKTSLSLRVILLSLAVCATSAAAQNVKITENKEKKQYQEIDEQTMQHLPAIPETPIKKRRGRGPNKPKPAALAAKD